MKLRLTKMHGAGNEFVVIDATRGMPPVSLAQWRWRALHCRLPEPSRRGPKWRHRN